MIHKKFVSRNKATNKCIQNLFQKIKHNKDA